MNERQDDRAERPPLLMALAALLFAEGAVLCCAVGWLVFELVTVTPANMATAVAFVVLSAIAAAWVLVTAFFTLRARSWIRGSALTWQIVQAAIAVSALQSTGATQAAGWLLLAASVAGVIILLSPPVLAATNRR